MVGEHLEGLPDGRSTIVDGPKVSPVLEVRDLAVSPQTCPAGLESVSFHLQRGEILGVAGISGNGQDELVGALTGRTAYSGKIEVFANGADGTESPRIGYIPADRRNTGSALSLSVMDNLMLRRYGKYPFSSRFLLRRDEIHKNALEKIRLFDIRPSDPSSPAWVLSGGNLQKVILARELEGCPHVVVAVNPTSGLDVATVRMVHRELLDKAKSGTGILYVSEDLDELFLLCDRIVVLRKGRVEGVFRVGEVDKRDIGLLMSRGNGHISLHDVEREVASSSGNH